MNTFKHFKCFLRYGTGITAAFSYDLAELHKGINVKVVDLQADATFFLPDNPRIDPERRLICIIDCDVNRDIERNFMVSLQKQPPEADIIGVAKKNFIPVTYRGANSVINSGEMPVIHSHPL